MSRHGSIPGLASWLRAMLLAACLAAGCAFAASPLDGLDADVRHALTVTATPGVAVAIVRQSEPLYVKGFGVRRAGSAQQVDPHTLFAIGSLTKAFTAADIAVLVDSGAMALDAPVRTYLPAFSLQDPYRAQHATIRDLLAHRTGLGDTNWLTVNTNLTPAMLIERLGYVVADAGFRETYLYQNTLYGVLGEAIKSVSGLDWASFTRQRILAPLGMHETLTHIPPAGANMAAPHLVDKRIARVIDPLDITNVAPAGAMYSSAADLVKWLAFQSREGEDSTLVTTRLFREMHGPQMTRKADPHLYPGANFVAYGLGWILWDYHGLRIVGHDGAIDGMTAKLCLVPALGVGIVVLANAEYSAVPNILVYNVLDRLTGDAAQPRKNWEEHFVPLVAALLDQRAATQAELESRLARGASPPTAVPGNYSSPLFGSVVVTLESQGTYVELLGRRWPLRALTDGSFVVDVGGIGLEHADFRLHFPRAASEPALKIAVGGHEYALTRAH